MPGPSPTPATQAPPGLPARRRGLRMKVAGIARWLHVYLSMLGLFVLLFFSATGITLNHPTWLGAAATRTTQAEGRLDPALVRPPATDSAAGVARLEVVEHLRAAHGLRGAVADFRADEYECSVTFKGPGYSADAFIDRETGRYDLTETVHGPVALLNDLHKGRDAGPAWSALIDASAALLIVASLSGLVLLFYIKRRRAPGLIVAAAGTAVVAGLLWFFVP